MTAKVQNSLRLIVVLFCIGISIIPASAQSSSGLSIDPRKDYLANPGQSINDNLPVSNLNDQLPLTLTLKVVDFTYLNNSGTPRLLLNPNTPSTTFSLKPYLNLPQTITIKPGDTEEVPLSLNIPKNQGAGSYYSAIEYVAAGNSGSSVNLNASGVTLLFVTVSGQAKEDMSLKTLGAYDPNDSTTGGNYVDVATSPPKEIAYTLINKGNLAESPAGSIVLQPMYGKDDIGIGNANTTSSLALIGQSRLFTACIQTEKQTVNLNGVITVNTVCNPKPHLHIGRYTIKLDVFYGQSGKTTNEITGVAHFWYIPWWFIISALVIIFLVILGLGWFINRIYGAVSGKTAKKKGFF
jgi:hypothetical protein